MWLSSKMNRFWVIGNSKKVLFPGKSVFIFLLSYFCTLFSKNWLFATRPPFLNRWYLINGSFLSRVTFHMVNVKRVVLKLLIWSNVCIWRLRFLIRPQSQTVLFICRGGSTTNVKVYIFLFSTDTAGGDGRNWLWFWWNGVIGRVETRRNDNHSSIGSIRVRHGKTFTNLFIYAAVVPENINRVLECIFLGEKRKPENPSPNWSLLSVWKCILFMAWNIAVQFPVKDFFPVLFILPTWEKSFFTLLYKSIWM